MYPIRYILYMYTYTQCRELEISSWDIPSYMRVDLWILLGTWRSRSISQHASTSRGMTVPGDWVRFGKCSMVLGENFHTRLGDLWWFLGYMYLNLGCTIPAPLVPCFASAMFHPGRVRIPPDFHAPRGLSHCSPNKKIYPPVIQRGDICIYI